MSITMPSPKKMRFTIDSGTFEYLKDRREITPPTNRGLCSISVSAYSSISSPSSEQSTDFPLYAESPQTLELAGFSQEAAKEVFAKYEQMIVDFPQFKLDLEQIACEWIEAKARADDAYGPADDYASAWSGMGVDTKTIERLLAVELQPARFRYSASEAFKKSVHAVSAYVNGLSENVQLKKSLLEARGEPPDPATSPTLAIRGGRHGPKNRSMPISHPQPEVQTVVDIPEKMPGHITLYKGAILSRLQKIWYSDTSKIAIEELRSTPPTDFDRQSFEMVYFTKDLETAETFCSFKSAFSPPVLMGIMHITVPTKLLDGDDFRLIHDPDWRQMVLECRGKRLPGSGRWQLPEHLRVYTQPGAFGLMGNICAQNNEMTAKIDDEMQIVAMTKTNGKAQQYCFLTDSHATLNKKCEGKVWIEERPFDSKGNTTKSSGKAVFREKHTADEDDSEDENAEDREDQDAPEFE